MLCRPLKLHPQKKVDPSHSFFHSLVPNPTQQRKATNSATPGGRIFIHWFIEPWVLLLSQSLKTKRGLDFSPRNLGLFSFRSKIPTFHVLRPRGSILFLAKVSLTSSWFFAIFLHKELLIPSGGPAAFVNFSFWWVMAAFEWKVCFSSCAMALIIFNSV